jgi:splicing factor 3A subunit 3
MLLVYEKLKKDMSEKEFRTEFEEYEDAQGNVFNRKTYEDLKRQGLI